MIALDTNLLVYSHRAGLPEHRAAQQALERACRDPRGWGIPFLCLAEFWSVVTHPESQGGGSSPAKAAEFLRALVLEAGAAVWTPQEGSWERVAKLAEDLNVRGPRIFDLQIAMSAFENGATEIWTHDRGFLAFPGLAVLDPL
ncbi:MAG: type II toxin-antitoxin system VapC family toxin [Bryobacteraceae bacterium]